MLEKLTLEQEALMSQVAREWIDLLVSPEYDEGVIRAGIEWLYEISGLDRPEIHMVASPKAAITLAKKLAPDCESYAFSSYGNASDYGWLSFHDFFSRIGLLSHAGLDRTIALMRAGLYDSIQMEGLCVCCVRPTFLHRNAVGQMHSTTGPAIGWSDGYCQHYVNGRAVPAEYFDRDFVTRERFLSEKNTENRAFMYAIAGAAKIATLLGTFVADSFRAEHGETIELHKTKDEFAEIGNKPFAWCKFICPSTGTEYMISVDGAHKSALDAAKACRPHIFAESEDYKWDART